jgi:transcriptional regulator GlxA family with amidase domain
MPTSIHAAPARSLKFLGAMARPHDIRIGHLIAMIQLRLADPYSVDELARSVNMSPSYLTRLFRQHTGRSPACFLREVRLRHAYELVQTTFLSIKQVMAAVGWNDPSHFSRAFKRYFGVSPQALRDALQREYTVARRA